MPCRSFPFWGASESVFYATSAGHDLVSPHVLFGPQSFGGRRFGCSKSLFDQRFAVARIVESKCDLWLELFRQEQFDHPLYSQHKCDLVICITEDSHVTEQSRIMTTIATAMIFDSCCTAMWGNMIHVKIPGKVPQETMMITSGSERNRSIGINCLQVIRRLGNSKCSKSQLDPYFNRVSPHFKSSDTKPPLIGSQVGMAAHYNGTLEI